MGLFILDRLHRGDTPRMVAVTAAQSDDRLVFSDRAGVDAFIEAHRRADSASSFTVFEVPEIGPREFWEACRDADWFYEESDDQSVWRRGGAALSRLHTQSHQSDLHHSIFMGWKRHKHLSKRYGATQYPAPEEPKA